MKREKKRPKSVYPANLVNKLVRALNRAEFSKEDIVILINDIANHKLVVDGQMEIVPRQSRENPFLD